MRLHRIWPTFDDPSRYRGYVSRTVGVVSPLVRPPWIYGASKNNGMVVESPVRPTWMERYKHDEPLAGDEVQPKVRWWTRLLRWLGIG